MVISGEIIGIIAGAATLLAVAAGVVGTWAVLKVRVQDNRTDIQELRDSLKEEIKGLREHLEGVQADIHKRIDRHRDDLDDHIRSSGSVHADLSKLTEAVDGIKEWLGRIERKLDSRQER